MRRRRTTLLRLETLEGRVLLSPAIADPAKTVQVKPAKAFTFNGTLYLSFEGRGNSPLEVSPGLSEKLPFKPMGAKVYVSGLLAHPKFQPGLHGLPDLSDSTFELSNSRGSLLVTFSPSTTNTYHFTISGGTKNFVTANGTTGASSFTYSKRFGDVLTFKSSKHAS